MIAVCLVKRNTNCAIIINSVGRVIWFDVAHGKLFTATGYAKLISTLSAFMS